MLGTLKHHFSTNTCFVKTANTPADVFITVQVLCSSSGRLQLLKQCCEPSEKRLFKSDAVAMNWNLEVGKLKASAYAQLLAHLPLSWECAHIRDVRGIQCPMAAGVWIIFFWNCPWDFSPLSDALVVAAISTKNGRRPSGILHIFSSSYVYILSTRRVMWSLTEGIVAYIPLVKRLLRNNSTHVENIPKRPKNRTSHPNPKFRGRNSSGHLLD